VGFFASSTVAIDIGSYSVKLALVNSDKELVKFVSVPTPVGAIEGGIIRNPEQITAVVMQVMKGLGVKEPNIVCTVPSQHVFVRYLTLPPMKKKELDQAVRFQAEGEIPIPSTEVVMDYAVIGENKGSKQIEVIVVATRKSVVQQLLHIFAQAKLQPKVFDLEALALARILMKSNRKKTLGNLDLIVSIGASHTHISVFAGDIPKFTRSIPFGGFRFTRALATERGISLEDAEQLKLAGESPEELENLLSDLTNEIKRSIDFYESQNKEQFVSQITLTGGGAMQAKLQEYVSAKLNLPVSIGNPLDQIKVPKKLAHPDSLDLLRTAFAPALGLTVRGLK
jgi:type IV pilus assembly protein PilM